MSDLGLNGIGSMSAYFHSRIDQFRQNLFSKIDANGDGSITKTELEQSVTASGGTTQASDALYAVLDPNNTGSVTEQQFTQNLPSLPFSGGMGAQLITDQAQQTAGGWTAGPSSQPAQTLFKQIDANGDGSISKTELEQAVTAAGGTSQAADALYAQLDPDNTGSVSEQTFAQYLAPPSPSGSTAQDAVLALLQSSAPVTSAPNSGPGSQLAQTLFSPIDANGDGSISKTELKQAVTAAGGTTQAADALYAQLDPNNTGSVSEQQFAQALSQAVPQHSHHHHHFEAAGTEDPLSALLSGSADAQSAQSLFQKIDTNGDGSISQTELEKAVTAAGGTTQAADALYAQLDPNNTGSVSEQTFAQYLAPPSPSGSTAEDALLALLQPASVSATDTTGAGTSGGNSVSQSGTAQDAIRVLLQSAVSAGSSASSANGSSAQDAWLSLFDGSAAADDSTASSASSASSNAAAASASIGGNTPQDALLALLEGSFGSLSRSEGLTYELTQAQNFLSAVQGSGG